MTIASAREWINSGKEPEIADQFRFSRSLLKKIIDITRVAILNFSSYKTISNYVNRNIQECENWRRWHVIAYSKGCGESLLNSDYYYIDMSYGDMRFEIFSGGNL